MWNPAGGRLSPALCAAAVIALRLAAAQNVSKPCMPTDPKYLDGWRMRHSLRALTVTRKGHGIAKWRDARGRSRAAPTTADRKRIILRARTHTAKYRDGSGRIVERATGCRDEDAAQAILAGQLKRAENVRGGFLTPEQAAVADFQNSPIEQRVGAYLAHLIPVLSCIPPHRLLHQTLAIPCKRRQSVAKRRLLEARMEAGRTGPRTPKDPRICGPFSFSAWWR